MPNPIKLAVFCRNLVDPNHSGTKTYLVEILTRLGSMSDFPLHITLVANSPEGSKVLHQLFQADGPWTVVTIPFHLWWRRLAWLCGFGAISKLIGRHDVYLSGVVWPFGIRDRSYIGVIHDFFPLHDLEERSQRWMYKLSRLLYSWAVRVSCRRSDRLVCISQATLTELRERFGEPSVPVEVIGHGVDMKVWECTASTLELDRTILIKYGLNPGKYIFTIGAHVPHKNHMRLVRAFHQFVLPFWPGGVLIVAGQFGNSTKDLQRYVCEHGLEKIILLPGPVSDVDYRALMRHCALFAFPSLIEGFGIPVVEAFAAGVPVVCSDIPVLREVAGDGAAYFPPRHEESIAAAIRQVIEERQYSQSLIEVGRARVKEMTWEHAAGRYLHLIREICGLPRYVPQHVQ